METLVTYCGFWKKTIKFQKRNTQNTICLPYRRHLWCNTPIPYFFNLHKATSWKKSTLLWCTECLLPVCMLSSVFLYCYLDTGHFLTLLQSQSCSILSNSAFVKLSLTKHRKNIWEQHRGHPNTKISFCPDEVQNSMNHGSGEVPSKQTNQSPLNLITAYMYVVEVVVRNY